MLISANSPPAKSVLESSIGFKNSMFVRPGEDLAAKYNWLKSGDRNAVMGEASVTNRRILILSPGQNSLSVQFTIDTDYIDIAAFGGNPGDAVVTRGNGGSCVLQTANDVRLSNFTVATTGTSDGQDEGGDVGFEIDAADNSPSIYNDMYFQGTAVATRSGLPMWGTSDISGLWQRCHATGWAWRLDIDKRLSAIMHDCVSWYRDIGQFDEYEGYGKNSFGGDTEGAEITGKFYRCIAGKGGFGGCGTWGCHVSGYFFECQSGPNSFALRRHFTGYAVRCIAGFKSFAGGTEYGGINARFAGTAIDCIAAGAGSGGMGKVYLETFKSFGMGGGESEGIGHNARIINCRYGTDTDLLQGITRAVAVNVASDFVAASATTGMAGGDNSNIILTAIEKGIEGNAYSFEIQQIPDSSAWMVIGAPPKLQVLYGANITKTAAELKVLLDAHGATAALVTITQVGDGSGDITEYAEQFYFGGGNPAVIRGNHPESPTDCTAATTVCAFDNGQTYTNIGAIGSVEFTLPPALKGYSYTFVKVVEQDVLITPDGAETIDGEADMDNVAAESDVVITLACYEDGEWITKSKTGTWA